MLGIKNLFERESSGKIGHFDFLLISIILVLVVRPFLRGIPGIPFITALLFSLIYLSAIYSVVESKRTFRITLFITVPILITSWISAVYPKFYILMINDTLSILFFLYTIVLLVEYLIRTKNITRNVIMCAVSTYFMLGFLWANMYMVFERFSSGSFKMVTDLGSNNKELLYFSFVTLTTLGYGDVTPLSEPARVLSLLESIIGQMFLAIMIARLVGIQISQSINKDSNDEKR
jgi:hypothetical protein